jgi:hypothetical protein
LAVSAFAGADAGRIVDVVPNRVEHDRRFAAGRRAVRTRLLGDRRLTPSAVDDLVAAWEREAERQRIDWDEESFWWYGSGWIDEQHGDKDVD